MLLAGFVLGVSLSACRLEEKDAVPGEELTPPNLSYLSLKGKLSSAKPAEGQDPMRLSKQTRPLLSWLGTLEPMHQVGDLKATSSGEKRFTIEVNALPKPKALHSAVGGRYGIALIRLFADADGDGRPTGLFHAKADSLSDAPLLDRQDSLRLTETQEWPYRREPGKDWLQGVAKYHFVLYLGDTMALRHWSKGAAEDNGFERLIVGYNLMRVDSLPRNLPNIRRVDWSEEIDFLATSGHSAFDKLTQRFSTADPELIYSALTPAISGL